MPSPACYQRYGPSFSRTSSRCRQGLGETETTQAKPVKKVLQASHAQSFRKRSFMWYSPGFAHPNVVHTTLTIPHQAQNLQLAPDLTLSTYSRTKVSTSSAQLTQISLTFLASTGQPLQQRPPGAVKLPIITLPHSFKGWEQPIPIRGSWKLGRCSL